LILVTEEAKLINIIKSITKSEYIGDDAAVIKIGDENFLFSLDNFVEHTHFEQDYFTSYEIGWKSLAVNISDIIAMRGKALYALVGINLSQNIEDKSQWIKEFYQGLQDCATKHDQVKIIGGDLCADKNHTSISVAIVGKALSPLYRSGAQVGDIISISGKSGNSANFLKTKNPLDKQYHLRPSPRTDLYDSLQGLSRGALMDTSDGLAQALMEIALQSNIDIDLDSQAIPKDEYIDLETALYGGEDYQLLLASEFVPQGFHPIGKALRNSDKPQVYFSNGEKLINSKAFQHFN
jgi:thiamine-monophosphate kinase